MTNSEIFDELDLLSPPADTIAETIDALGMSIGNFAEQMEIPLNEAAGLAFTAYPITEHIAEKLERVLKIDRSFWLNRERDYRKKLNELHTQLRENAKD